MIDRKEVADILYKYFGYDDGIKVLEFIESITHTHENVATHKDIYELKLEIEKNRTEIEKVRADLTIEIGKNRTEIEKVRADLIIEIEKNRTEIEKIRADLINEIGKNRTETEKIRADLINEIGKTKTEIIKWTFGFWITQIVVLAGILYKLLS
ncbi:MAG: hypothetical protein ACE5KT_00250 [Methanosarcinales archaeon]